MAYIPNYKARKQIGPPQTRPTETDRSTSQNQKPNHNKDPFYRTNKWRTTSENHRTKNPYCAQCKREGRIVFGTLTDHTIPKERGGAPLNPKNLQTLCDPCHNRKRQLESKGKIQEWELDEDLYKIPKQ